MIITDQKHSKSRDIGILVWGRIIGIGAESLLPLILIWLLGNPGEMGVYATLMLIYRMLTMVLTVGFPRAALYFFNRDSMAEKRELAEKIFLLMIGLGGVAGLLLVLLSGVGNIFHDQLSALLGSKIGGDAKLLETLIYLKWMALYAVLDVSSRILPEILIAEHKPKAAAAIPVIQSCSFVIGSILPVLIGYKTGGIVFGLTIAGIIRLLIYVVYMHLLYGKIKKTKGAIRTIDLVTYSIPLGLTNVVSELKSGMDLWLLLTVYIASAKDIAVYSAGSWQIPAVTTIAFTVGSVYLGTFKSLHLAGKSAEAIEIWRKLTKKISLIVIPVGASFAIAAPEFIAIIFPDGYLAAAPVFRAYCFLTMARVAAFGSLLIAAGRPGDVIKASFWTLAVKFCLSLPLVYMFGFLGPAIGTALTAIPDIIIHCYFIAKAYKVRISKTFPVVTYLCLLAIVALPVGVAILFKQLCSYNVIVMFVGQVLIVCVGFSVLATFFGKISKEDWRFVLRWMTFR